MNHSNSNGFSLVELMVVVTIIGILSAVIIPNFKKYQSKSKQSEAKIQLATLYTFETSAKADFNTYGTCLNTLGYEQVPLGYYVVGFNAGVNATDIGPTCIITEDFNMTPTSHSGVIIANIPTTLSDPASIASQNTFLSSAEGSIASSGVNALDRWTMNEAKALVNTVIGY